MLLLNHDRYYIAIPNWQNYNDIEAIEQLHAWNESSYYSLLGFIDVHEYKQARDSSLYCSIKQSLSERMRMCKTFILIVGEHTKRLTKGSCSSCSKRFSCISSHNTDSRSYVEYECELAVKSGLKIVVLYNSNVVNKNLCPEAVRDIGIHTAMKCYNTFYYPAVRDAIMY